MQYQHSGRFTLSGILLGLAVGTAGGSVLAYAYGAGLILIPEVHLAAFATIAFGGLVGAATGFGLVRGHVRNKQIALGVGAVTSVLALYLSWAVWISAVYLRFAGEKINWTKLAQHPTAVWELMQWINQSGTWTMDNGKAATKGWELWTIWGLEAALVIGLGMFFAFGMVRKHPFCETCGQWCRRTLRFFLAPVQDVHQLKLRLESNDLQSLAGLGPGPKIGDRITVDLESCNTCGHFHTLDVVQTLTQRRKYGRPQVTSQTIVHQMLLGPSEAQLLRELAEKSGQTQKPSNGKVQSAAAAK